MATTFRGKDIKDLRRILGDTKVDTFLLVLRRKPNTMERYLKTTDEEYETFNKVKECLEQMEKCGKNRWWNSEDKRVLAYYQLMNPILLIPFDKFHEALEFLLGRPVGIHEMGVNYEGLKAEAERAFKGTQDSAEQKAESIKESFEKLAATGIPVMCVVVE